MLPRPVTASSHPAYPSLSSLPRLSRDYKRSLLRPWLASPTAGSGGGSFAHPPSPSYGGPSTAAEHLNQVLRARSRITNLGVYILLGLLALSSLVHVRGWLEDGGVRWAKDGSPLDPAGSPAGARPGELPAGRGSLPQSVVNTLGPLAPELADVDHLIVVAGCVARRPRLPRAASRTGDRPVLRR